MSARHPQLGLRENLPQFSLLLAVNVFVGAMVGLERSALPLVGRDEFDLTSSVAVLSFIVAFGLVKALTNLFAGALAQRVGRRRLLIAGWAVALPVPLLIATAPSWAWIVAANVLLGVNQGLAWSMTVVMKIDLVGPEAARLRAGAERGRRLRRSRPGGGVERLARSRVCGTRRARRRRGGHRGGWVPAQCAVRPRHRRPRCPRADAPPRRRRQPAPAAGGVRAGELPRAGAALLLAGGPGQQPQRRPGLGAGAAVPGRSRRRGRRGRTGRRGLSGRLERRADRHRPLVGQRRAQAADRGRHVRSGGGARGAGAQQRRHPRRCRSRRPAGPRDRAGLPDADRRDLRRGLPRRARPRGRRLSLLARHGLRARRPDRGRHGRRARLRRRDRARRRADRRLRALGAARHADRANPSVPPHGAGRRRQRRRGSRSRRARAGDPHRHGRSSRRLRRP